MIGLLFDLLLGHRVGCRVGRLFGSVLGILPTRQWLSSLRGRLRDYEVCRDWAMLNKSRDVVDVISRFPVVISVVSGGYFFGTRVRATCGYRHFWGRRICICTCNSGIRLIHRKRVNVRTHSTSGRVRVSTLRYPQSANLLWRKVGLSQP